MSSAYGDQSDSYWICTTCHTYFKREKMPPMSNKNDLQLFDVSNIPDLHLSPLENALIALNICFQMIFQTAKSRWNKTKKQLVNIPINEQDVVNTLDAMPRTPQQAGVVNVQLKHKKSMTTSHCQQFVDVEKLHRALHLLKGIGNPFYQDISDRLGQSNEYQERCRQDDPNGYEFLFGEGENVDPDSTFINQDVLDALNDEFVIGSNSNEDEGEGEAVAESVDDQFMNLDPVRRQQFQNERATMFVNDFPEVDVRDPHGPNIPVVVAPGEGKIPTNILKETNWDLKSFPCLYPDGKNGLHQKRDVDLSMQSCLQQRLLNVDGRFAKHPTFVFAAFAANELNTLERNINISFMRGKKSTSATGRTKYSIEDPYSVLENSPGTPVFFKKKRYELIAKMENLGPFNLFFTLSCGEKRYNENFTTFLKDHHVPVYIHR